MFFRKGGNCNSKFSSIYQPIILSMWLNSKFVVKINQPTNHYLPVMLIKPFQLFFSTGVFSKLMIIILQNVGCYVAIYRIVPWIIMGIRMGHASAEMVLLSLPQGTVSWSFLNPSKNYILHYDPVHMYENIMKTKVLKAILRLMVSALTCKELGSCHSHSYNKKKPNKLKISGFSWSHWRTKVVG